MIPPVFRKPFFISFFLLLIMLFSVSAYNIVHYDDFKYTANYTGLINYHGFLNQDGVKSCLASIGSEHYLLCYDSVSKLVTQKYNQVTYPFCISANNSILGGARNFSVRLRVRGDSAFSPYTSSHNIRFYATSHNSTSDASFALFTENISATDRVEIYRNALYYTLINEPQNYNWYYIQLDYYVRNNAGNAEVFASNITALSPLNGSYMSEYNTLTTPRLFNCINTTNLYFRGGHYIDYIYIITYDAGETYLAPTAALPDVGLANDSMPLFSAVVTNKNGLVTTRTDTTTDCTPIPIPFTNTTKENPKCNPLYFSAPGAFDAEGDIMSIGVSCNNAQEYLFFDDMSADLSILNPRYLTKCNYTKILYNSPDGNQYYGLGLANTMNCTAPILTSSFSNSTAEPNLLSNLASDIIEFDFYPDNENLTHFDFTNYNLLRVIQLGIRYNATRGGFVIYENGIEKYLAGGFDTSSATTLKIVLDKATYTYTYSLLQGTVTKKRFYSTPVSFDWTIPISIFEFYVTDSSGNFAKDGTAFGRLSGHYITLPSLETWNVNKVFNCTSANYGYYRAYMFMSDGTHGLNYGNYEAVDWTVETIPLNTDIINAVQPDSFENGWSGVFMGSQTLKYIFALMVFLALVFGSFAAGAALGNPMAGGIVAMFTGVAVIFFFILMGILPTWFGIVIFMVMALITAFIIRKVFVPTAN